MTTRLAAGEVPPEPPEIVLGPLLLGGGGDGDDAVVAGVEGRGEAADGAALAAGVPPLEDQHRRKPLRLGLAPEAVDAPLRLLQPFFVLLVLQFLRQVEAVQDAFRPLAEFAPSSPLCAGVRCGRGRRDLRRRGLRQAGGEHLQDGRAHGQRLVPRGPWPPR